MTSDTHNKRIHYFLQHWQVPVSLVQLLWPGTLIAEDTALIPRVLLSVAQYQFSTPLPPTHCQIMVPFLK